MTDTADRVRRVLAEETGREPHRLGPDTELRADLGLDDAGVRHLLIELESEFDVVCDSDDVAEVTTLGRLVRLVERHQGRFARRRRRA